jgi:hypothetical protein
VKIVRWLLLGVLALVLLAFLVGVAARFADGPVGPFPGGPLQAGELGPGGAVDWSAQADVREIELQLVDPPRSRTTWLVVRDGVAYVPCGFPNARLLKQWPHELAEDDRVVVRVGAARYERRAVRVTDAEEWHALAAISEAKYGHRTPSYPDDVWFFRLEPREEP